jgi:hypothetical protein
MNERPNEILERELSDRFDRGDLQNATPEERRILRMYDKIQVEIKRCSAPVVDRKAIVQVLTKECKKPKNISPSRWTFFQPIIAYGGFPCLLIVLGIGIIALQSKPVRQLHVSGDSQAVSWIWEKRLQWGKIVTIPKECEAEFQLADGSIVSCSPETQIAVRFDSEREIDLQHGAISVHAAHIEGSTMTV